ncbi:unnamed protein product [Closterium sp. NIES-53]
MQCDIDELINHNLYAFSTLPIPLPPVPFPPSSLYPSTPPPKPTSPGPTSLSPSFPPSPVRLLPIPPTFYVCLTPTN